jgi:hypothetical protein
MGGDLLRRVAVAADSGIEAAPCGAHVGRAELAGRFADSSLEHARGDDELVAAGGGGHAGQRRGKHRLTHLPAQSLEPTVREGARRPARLH